MNIDRWNKSLKLYSVNETLHNAGTTVFKINGRWISAVVSNSIKQEVILSWRDMRRLQIISDSFPGPIYALTAEGKPDVKPDVSASDLKLLEEIKDHVYTEFKDVN